MAVTVIKKLLELTVPVNKEFLKRNVPVNNFFLNKLELGLDPSPSMETLRIFPHTQRFLQLGKKTSRKVQTMIGNILKQAVE